MPASDPDPAAAPPCSRWMRQGRAYGQGLMEQPLLGMHYAANLERARSQFRQERHTINQQGLSGDNEVVPRFASITCYLFCLSPGNTGIHSSSDLASSVRSAPAEFARTTSHRVAQGYRTTTGIDPGPGGSPGPRGPWRERPHWAGPASDPARGPAA